jgi:hypothetical protein
MTNSKIEKIKVDIAKTKTKLSELSSKLREQEKALKLATDEAILAMFKDETVSDDELKAIRRQGFGESETPAETVVVSAATNKIEIKKEEPQNAFETDN